MKQHTCCHPDPIQCLAIRAQARINLVALLGGCLCRCHAKKSVQKYAKQEPAKRKTA